MMALMTAWSVVRANWKIILGVFMGALMCWPVASCQGKREANATNAAKVIAASAKVEQAAAKAEAAAVLADMARNTKSREEITELRRIVDETQSDAGVGPATAKLLERLRARER